MRNAPARPRGRLVSLVAGLRAWMWALLAGTAVCLCFAGYEVGAAVRSSSARSRGRTEGWRSFPFESAITQRERRTREAQQAEMFFANLRPDQFKEGSGSYIATYGQSGRLRELCGADTLLQTTFKGLVMAAVGQQMMTGSLGSGRTGMQTVDRVLGSVWRPWFSIGTKVVPGRWYSVSADGSLYRSR